MLSQTAEYALRAVVYLAEHDNTPHTIHQIAGPTKIPAGYLAKVLQALVRHGLLTSQRGLGGGFTLAIAPEQLTLYAVIQAVDPIMRITRCPIDKPDHASELCALHKRLDSAASMMEEMFRNTIVAEMVTTRVFDACP